MTDRIEAINERLESRKAFRVHGATTWTSEADDDMAVLLTELRRARFHEQNNFANWKEAEAKTQRVVQAVENALSWHVERDARAAVTDAMNAALAPTAPDAEPTEWKWSPGDVVQDPEDGTVSARSTDGTYPWHSTNGVDQRDQDITDLVTKRGGRVLVCKARGIGVGGAR